MKLIQLKMDGEMAGVAINVDHIRELYEEEHVSEMGKKAVIIYLVGVEDPLMSEEPINVFLDRVARTMRGTF